MIITVAEARLRGVTLPSDDDAAQAAIDEQVDWLAKRVGPLDGERTETFYVGFGRARGCLYLRRYTDAVVIVDGPTTLVDDQFVLEGNGSSVRRQLTNYPLGWTGPYVTATYRPNDEDSVRKVLIDLLTLAAGSVGALQSETIGAYTYNRGNGKLIAGQRGTLASSLLPRRPSATTLDTGDRAWYGMPA